MRSSGYITLMQIAGLPDQDVLKEVWGIGEKTAENISTAVAQHFGIDTQTAYSYAQRLQKFQLRVSTGSKAIDTLLGGGVATKQITEFYGSPQMGKTQLCYSIAVHSLIDSSLGGYIDLKKIDERSSGISIICHN